MVGLLTASAKGLNLKEVRSEEGFNCVKNFLMKVYLHTVGYGILASWVLWSGATLPTRILKR